MDFPQKQRICYVLMNKMNGTFINVTQTDSVIEYEEYGSWGLVKNYQTEQGAEFDRIKMNDYYPNIAVVVVKATTNTTFEILR